MIYKCFNCDDKCQCCSCCICSCTYCTRNKDQNPLDPDAAIIPYTDRKIEKKKNVKCALLMKVI